MASAFTLSIPIIQIKFFGLPLPSLPATFSWQSVVRPGLCPSQPDGGRLLWAGVPGPAQDDGTTLTHHSPFS